MYESEIKGCILLSILRPLLVNGSRPTRIRAWIIIPGNHHTNLDSKYYDMKMIQLEITGETKAQIQKPGRFMDHTMWKHYC